MKSIRKSIVFTPITAIVWLIAVNCLIFSSCEKDDVFDVNQPKYSDNQYAIMLRSKVEKQTGKSGTFKNSLIIKHGLPLWENAKWVKTNTGRVLVVPLLSGSPNMKNLIGIIEDNEIIPVITELPVSGHESKKIYSIYNQILYDSKIGIIPTIRLKSASVESDDVTLEGLLTDVCGTAADLFNASNTGCSYNPYETFGTIRICTGGTDGGSSASWSTDGVTGNNKYNVFGNHNAVKSGTGIQ